MKKSFLHFLLIAPLLIGSFAAHAFPNYRTKSPVNGGLWSNKNIWQVDLGSGYQDATTFPTYLDDNIEIRSGDSVHLDISFLADNTTTLQLDQVTILNGAKLVVDPGVTYTIADAGASIDLNVVGRLIFTSNFTNTARLGPVPAGAQIFMNNNVTFERYVQGRRKYRWLTAPLRKQGSDDGKSYFNVLENWQEHGTMSPPLPAGYGTLVTAPIAPSPTNGIDANSGNSLFTLNSATNTLEGVNDTKTAPLITNAAFAANNSYFIFIRGDRNVSTLTAPNTNNTIIRATGELQYGDQQFNLPNVGGGDRFIPVGNPYISAVDFANLERSNLKPRFYGWDPKLGNFGGYVLVQEVNGQYAATPNTIANGDQTATNLSQNIQPGQAFLVETISSGLSSITFEEADKNNQNNNSMFRPTGSLTMQISANLTSVLPDNKRLLMDGNVAMFNDKFSNDLNGDDAGKPANPGESFSIKREGKMLMSERRALMTGETSIFYNMANLEATNYELEFQPSTFEEGRYTAALEDAFLKTSTPIRLNGVTYVPFKVTTDPASSRADRFTLVFKENNVLPIGFTSVNAFQKSQGIQVEWKLATELGVKEYVVEKSLNGQNFTALATVKSRNGNAATAYDVFDATAVKGDNFYRIKAIQQSGDLKISNVVNVKIGKGKSEIVVYPNPITDKNMSLQFRDQPQGIYSIQLINSVGQLVYKGQINHAGGSATQTVQVTSEVQKGVYQLQVINGATKQSQKVVFR